jgi:hypothetical protein
MPRNDPTETGGLFIGRRPGTAPLRYRHRPVARSAARRRLDRALAGAILLVETLVLATLWGPQPAGWLWIGSQIDYQMENIVLAIATAFAGMLATFLATLAFAMRLDHAWKLVRRAAGFEQKEGMLERIFVIGMFVGGIAFAIWLLVIEGPGSSFSPTSVIRVLA